MKRGLLACSVLTGLFFFPIFFGKVVFFGDNYSLLVPGKIFTAMHIRQGEFALWNPYLFLGQSWIGNINESILYPSTLIFLWFNPGTALSVTLLLHTIFSGLGAYLLSRYWIVRGWVRIITVALWILSLQWIATIDNLAVNQSAALIPYVILACVRLKPTIRSLFMLSIVIVLQIAGGYPQLTPYSVLFGVVLLGSLTPRTDFRRLFVTLCAAGIIAILLSAAYWMPFVTLLRTSTRAVQSTAQIAVGGLHPAELLRVFFPTLFDDPAIGMKWALYWNRGASPGLYVPLFVILALVFSVKHSRARIDGIAIGIVGTSLLLAVLGYFGYSPLAFLPLFSASRGAGLALLPATLIFALWAGTAIERFQLSTQWYRRGMMAIGVMFVLVSLGGFVVLFFFPALWHQIDWWSAGRLQHGWHTMDRDRLIVLSLGVHTWIQLMLAAGMLTALVKKRYQILVALLVIDLFVASHGRVHFGPAVIYPSWEEILSSTHPLAQAQGNDRLLFSNGNTPYTDFATYWDAYVLRAPFSDSFVDTDELTHLSRIRSMRALSVPDWNMVYRIRSLNGYAAFVPLDLDQRFASPTADPSINSLPEIPIDHPLLQTYGIGGYWIDTWYPQTVRPALIETALKIESAQLYHFASGSSRFRIESGESGALVISESVNRQEISVTLSTPSAMIIADRYDPNWKATRNGQPLTIENRSGIRALSLPAGKSDVVLEYDPIEWKIGITITVVTVLGVMLLWLWSEDHRVKRLK